METIEQVTKQWKNEVKLSVHR